MGQLQQLIFLSQIFPTGPILNMLNVTTWWQTLYCIQSRFVVGICGAWGVLLSLQDTEQRILQHTHIVSVNVVAAHEVESFAPAPLLLTAYSSPNKIIRRRFSRTWAVLRLMPNFERKCTYYKGRHINYMV